MNGAVNGFANGFVVPSTNGDTNGTVNGADTGHERPVVNATAYEIELDETPPGRERGAGGHHPGCAGGRGRGARLPIIPAHLRPENLQGHRAARGGRAGHVPAFHAVRSPWYWPKFGLVRRAWSVAGGWASRSAWWWVPNSFALEQKAADASELKEWEKIHRQLKATRLWRGGRSGGCRTWRWLIGVPIALERCSCRLVCCCGRWLRSPGLAHYGRPAGQTLVGTAVVAPRFRKLNSDIVLRAYYAAGLGKPDKADQEVRFGSPMSRDARNTGSQVRRGSPVRQGLVRCG